MLKTKKILVGVCGGIAAYKVVEIVSMLKKMNADVHVIMTESAVEFVKPLTFQSITHNPVIYDMFSEPKKWNIEHVAYAEMADLFLIAPATANIIGKVSAGIADDMLSTTIMATQKSVLFVPAMNVKMFTNLIVQDNIRKLKRYGYNFIEPEYGRLAYGDNGLGRFPESQKVISLITKLL
ncbi:flavoprotein [Paenibacillus donghaensis]|uniref:Flavoprotein domain-containing protein n=1 Tax=Paenibacillus donghaensis TaxID=414771 RepID=A0A2Z2KNR0_9BACL|nr:flavoprotein [Paenibacillus donghaensis]ASA24259.1 hypothetical protein B9T62_27960 [Paenibacillus donghaensis]